MGDGPQAGNRCSQAGTMPPPRRTSTTPATSAPAGWLLVEITEDADAPELEFVEVWDADGSGDLVEKAGGVYGGAENPGLDVLGAGLATGDYALARSAAGNGGLTWELVPTVPASVWKTPAARARTTAALPACTYANGTSGVGATLTGDSNGALAAQDGQTILLGETLLVADQATTYQNGLYTLTQFGGGGSPFVLTRRTDADAGAELLGAAITVTTGTQHADTTWVCTADATITVGATALLWRRIEQLSQWKTPACEAATTAALPACTYANGSSGVGATLTGNANGALPSQDSQALLVGYSLLVKDQAAPAQNGIYVVTQVGSASLPFILTRRGDADSGAKFQGAVVAVYSGVVHTRTIWLCTLSPGSHAVGASSINWIENPRGDVVGPASATDNYVALFDGVTGKLIKVGPIEVSNLVAYLGDTTIHGGANSLAFTLKPSNPTANAGLIFTAHGDGSYMTGYRVSGELRDVGGANGVSSEILVANSGPFSIYTPGVPYDPVKRAYFMFGGSGGGGSVLLAGRYDVPYGAGDYGIGQTGYIVLGAQCFGGVVVDKGNGTGTLDGGTF